MDNIELIALDSSKLTCKSAPLAARSVTRSGKPNSDAVSIYTYIMEW